MRLILASGAIFFAAQAAAAPPPPGSPQADMMAPYSDWVRSLHNPNTHIPCCSLADCREAEWRVQDGHYQVFIDSDSYENGPNKWVEVPDHIVLHGQNPIGAGLACWSSGRPVDNGLYCFSPGAND